MACRFAQTLCMSFLLLSAFTLSALESSYTIKEGETLSSVARRVAGARGRAERVQRHRGHRQD